MTTIPQKFITARFWLEPAAAESYLRMRAAGMPAGINDAGRTRAEQQRLYDLWRAGKMPNTPTVAYPGTSNHESGRALDLPEPARSWIRTHGHQYGWTNPAWAQRPRTLEPWHFEYSPKNDTTDWSSMASPDEIKKIVDAAIAKAIPDAIDQALARVIGGRDPATGKPRTLDDSLQLARNYPIHNHARLGEVIARLKSIETKITKP